MDCDPDGSRQKYNMVILYGFTVHDVHLLASSEGQ